MGKVTRAQVEAAGYNGINHNTPDWLSGAPFVRQLDMFWLFVDPEDTSIGCHLMKDGFWESWVTAWFCNTITEDMNCIDIGANQGYFTFLLANLAKNGTVHAFEPMPRYVDLLETTSMYWGYKNVLIYDCAIADRFDQVQLVVPGFLRGSASIEVEDFGGLYGEEERFSVRTRPLDSMGIRSVDFIKIDAEGSEDKIWRGMQKTLERNPQCIVLMEYDTRRYPDNTFRDSLYETMDVSIVDYEGGEQPITKDELNWLPDLAMLVLRRKH